MVACFKDSGFTWSKLACRVALKYGLCEWGDFLTLENGTDRLSRNDGKDLPLLAA